MTDAASAEAPNPAVLRAEQRLRLLEELAQMEMDLARALQRRAIAAANPTPPAESDAAAASAPGPVPETAEDLSAAFARIARSLRLTLALQARAEEQLRALLAGEAAKVEVRRAEASRRAASEARARSDYHRTEVECLVLEAAEREVEDEEALDSVLEALEERLDDDEAYWDLDDMSVREAVERLCADLELSPDWSRWQGAGWTPKPPFSRSRFSVWARPSRTPLRPFEDPRAHRRE
ncbi:MAG TPA: hypothetical protein VGG92_16390 [Caulobacteraceae bacterium]